MTFWWRSFPLSEGVRPCEDLRTRWSGVIRVLPCISTSRNVIILKRRGSWSIVSSHIFNILWSECNLSLSKRDFFALFCCNTQSYWIRVFFFIFLNINKSDSFSYLLICLDFFFVLKIRQVEAIIFDLLEVWYSNLASQSWKIPFKQFLKKVIVRSVY